jgi:SAM-dependent methyltransferase
VEPADVMVELFSRVKRLGPGSETANATILERIAPAFRKRPPRIADMGCGVGAATIPLARALKRPVFGLDHEPKFLSALQSRAAKLGVDAHIHLIEADVGRPPLKAGAFDLLWAEGVAYAVGLENALAAWYPVLRQGGFLVFSEPLWVVDRPSKRARDFWAVVYPGMGDGERVRTRVERQGFTFIGAERMEPKAWWENYYRPLARAARRMELWETPEGRAVLADLRWEMAIVEKCLGEFQYALHLARKDNT